MIVFYSSPRWLAFIGAIALTVAGIFTAFVLWPSLGIHKIRVFGWQARKPDVQALNFELSGISWPVLQIDITAPAEVRVGDSFSIALKASVVTNQQETIFHELSDIRFRLSSVDLIAQPGDYVNLTMSDPNT